MRLRNLWAAVLMVAALLAASMHTSSAVAGLCGGPDGPPDSPAEAVTRALPPASLEIQQTRIHWTRWPSSVTYGDQTTLEGQVVTDQGALADATVDLLARPAGAQRWQHVATTTTDPDTGVFSFGCLQPTTTTLYQAAYHGSAYYAGSRSNRQVPVTRRVPDQMVQVAAARFRYTGTVQPRYAGRTVTLQQRRCPGCPWRTSDRTSSSSRSHWRFVIDASTFTGRRWFRALIPQDEQFAASPSAHVWRLTVQ